MPTPIQTGQVRGSLPDNAMANVALTPEQLSEIQETLESALRKLLKSMGMTEQAMETVVLDQTAVGRLSRIDSLQNQAMAKGLHEREQARLGQIQTALARLAAGQYGICLECDNPLEFGRLMVFPEAPTCPACS